MNNRKGIPGCTVVCEKKTYSIIPLFKKNYQLWDYMQLLKNVTARIKIGQTMVNGRNIFRFLNLGVDKQEKKCLFH